MRCAAPTQAKVELNWSVLGLTLVGLMSVAGLKSRRVDPLEWSPAASLRVLRRWRRTPACPQPGATGSPGGLLGELGRCVKDRYTRLCSKRSWCWPHKKNPPPPGAPTVTPATKALRDLAAAA